MTIQDEDDSLLETFSGIPPIVYSELYRTRFDTMLRNNNTIRETLDDQTQVDSKPAGQPEHASLNQCQLIAANRQKLVLWAPPAGGGDKVSQ